MAFGSVPKDGGTFTFYRNLRAPLLKRGIDLRCVTVGQRECSLWDNNFADDGCERLASTERNIKKQALAFSNWCDAEGVQIVFGVNSVAILSALPHLSENIRIMSRCANAFEHGYRITVACIKRLSRIVALAPRQVEDLVEQYGVAPGRIVLIPNGTNVERFEAAADAPRGTLKRLRLGFLGRIEHSQKGVLYLPELLDRLKALDIKFSLSIAGRGVHEHRLREKLDSYLQSGQVRFVGALDGDEIAGYLGNIDVFILPSHFEGSPNALIESMMAGCVPAAWNLHGITDFLIEDGINGILAKTGDSRELADKIAALANDRSILRGMSHQASKSARQRFSLGRVVCDYVNVINEVMNEPAIEYQVKSWNEFRVESAFAQPFWRRVAPSWAKKVIKKALFQLRLADRYE